MKADKLIVNQKWKKQENIQNHEPEIYKLNFNNLKIRVDVNRSSSQRIEVCSTEEENVEVLFETFLTICDFLAVLRGHHLKLIDHHFYLNEELKIFENDPFETILPYYDSDDWWYGYPVHIFDEKLLNEKYYKGFQEVRKKLLLQLRALTYFGISSTYKLPKDIPAMFLAELFEPISEYLVQAKLIDEPERPTYIDEKGKEKEGRVTLKNIMEKVFERYGYLIHLKDPDQLITKMYNNRVNIAHLKLKPNKPTLAPGEGLVYSQKIGFLFRCIFLSASGIELPELFNLSAYCEIWKHSYTSIWKYPDTPIWKCSDTLIW